MSRFLGFLMLLASASAFVSSPTSTRSWVRRAPTSTTLMMVQTGTVKWFDPTKGFGFIIPDGEGADVFVHQSAIQADGFRSLEDGEAVEFEVETRGDGRLAATSVTGPGGINVKGASRVGGGDDEW